MLKRSILMIIFYLQCLSVSFAGQGLYLKLVSYIPGANVKVLNSSCVSGTDDITMNHAAYLENTCILDQSSVKIALLYQGKEFQHYTITISQTGSNLYPDGMFTKDGVVAVASLYPHIGLLGSQDRVTISFAKAEDDWMGQLANRISQKKISSVLLPGTHNSGTYAMTTNSEVATDISSALRPLAETVKSYIKDWSVTQNLDVKTQLQVGIRYLDLRICKSKNNTLVTCHGLVGASLQQVLNQVADFLKNEKHNKEIVILDMNHLYDLNTKDLENMAMLLKKSLGNKIASSLIFNSNSLLTTFWQQKKQVILFLDNEKMVHRYPDLFWSQKTIFSAWADKDNDEELIGAMDSNLRLRDPSKLFVLQTIETPTAKTIIDGLNFTSRPNSLLKLTTQYKAKVENWLNQADIQTRLKTKGNIFIEDFSNGIDLTELSKKLN